jgi:hypothetical protein
MKIVKDVKSKIDDDRRLALGQEIAQHAMRKVELEEAKKKAGSEYTVKLKAELEALNRKSKALLTGELEEAVECETIEDFERNEVRTVRCDSGEIVATRAMTGDERQTTIDGIPEASVETGAGAKRKRLPKAGTVTDDSEPTKAH